MATMADMATAMRNLELNNQMMNAELLRLRQQAAQANQYHAQGMHPNMGGMMMPGPRPLEISKIPVAKFGHKSLQEAQNSLYVSLRQTR